MMQKAAVFLLASLIAGLAQADDRLGRLFLTPNERANLDYLRNSSPPPEKLIKSEAPETNEADGTPIPPPVAPVTIQGYVKRSDGKGTVWVNRQAVQEKSKVGEIEVGSIPAFGNRVRVKVPGANQSVTLKAGQTFDPVSGQIVDYSSQLRDVREPRTSVGPDKTTQPVPTTDVPKKP